MPDYQQLVSQALAGSRLTWLEETRRRLLVVLGNTAALQRKSTLDLWLTYLTTIGYTVGSVLERQQKWAPGVPPSYAALNISTAFSVTQSNYTGASTNPVSTASPVVTGGIGPYTYALGGDALPAGLSFNTGTGAITGTMTVPAPTTLNLTLTVTDSVGRTTAAYPFTITLT